MFGFCATRAGPQSRAPSRGVQELGSVCGDALLSAGPGQVLARDFRRAQMLRRQAQAFRASLIKTIKGASSAGRAAVSSDPRQRPAQFRECHRFAPSVRAASSWPLKAVQAISRRFKSIQTTNEFAGTPDGFNRTIAPGGPWVLDCRVSFRNLGLVMKAANTRKVRTWQMPGLTNVAADRTLQSLGLL